MNPQITVIIPAYRRKNYLFYALDRIFSQKDVTLEVLVFSEVMEPDEVDEVKNVYPQVKYFKTDKYKGASNKRRAGIKMARGKYLYMQDDDDYLTDDKFLKKDVDIMEQNDDISIVMGLTDVSYEYADNTKKHVEHRPLPLEGKIDRIEYLQGLQVTMSKPISTVSTLFRTKDMIARGVDQMFEISDVCLCLNAFMCGHAYIINEPVAVYRFHEKNLTYSLPYWFMFNVLREKERIYKEAKKILPQPKEFWYNHFRITYFFYKEGKANLGGKINMLSWGLCHVHGNYPLLMLLVKEYIKCLIGR